MKSKTIGIIFLILWTICCIVNVAKNMAHYKIGDWIVILIVAAIPYIVYFTIKNKKQSNKLPKGNALNSVTTKVTEKSNLKMSKPNECTIQITVNHVHGLPIAENLICKVYSYPDRLEFKSGTTSINLPRNKITDMCIKTDVEIQKQMISSAGGAVAGGLAFGPLGAIIGGRVKTKNIINATNYLIITYTDNSGKLAYIGFGVTGIVSYAEKLIKEFKQLNSTSGIQINL